MDGARLCGVVCVRCPKRVSVVYAWYVQEVDIREERLLNPETNNPFII